MKRFSRPDSHPDADSEPLFDGPSKSVLKREAQRAQALGEELIGLNDAGKRWVLKNPSHLFALDALMTAYPDALVIQTHRPVETIMASMC